MDDLAQHKLAMYLAVKAVCDAKLMVWQQSEAFEDAFTDFCKCLDNIARLQAAVGIFGSVVPGIALEMAVADTILTTDLDDLVEQLTSVDPEFVQDYTAARLVKFADEQAAPEPVRRAG